MNYYTIREVADILNVSRGRVRQMVVAPEGAPDHLPSTLEKDRTGRKYRLIPKSAVDRMVQARLKSLGLIE